jgi:hypothetical protein
MGKTSSYSAINLAVSLDGIAVVGLFSGDNAIQVDQNVDAGTGLVGVQGDSIFSQTADRSAAVTLRLMHTSPTHRQLIQKWNAQRAGRLVPFPFDHMDTKANEGGSGDEFYIMRAPSDTKGSNATVREWVIWTGDYTPAIPNA